MVSFSSCSCHIGPGSRDHTLLSKARAPAHYHHPHSCPCLQDMEKITLASHPAQKLSQKTRVPEAVTWWPSQAWWSRNVRPFSSRVSLTGREATPTPRSQLNGNSSASASDPGCWSTMQEMGVAKTQGIQSNVSLILGPGRSQPLLLGSPTLPPAVLRGI